MTTYAGAVPVTSVVRPSWCTVPQREHLDELGEWEGHCIHWSRGTTDNGRTGAAGRSDDVWYVDHACGTLVDGTVDDEGHSIHVGVTPNGIYPEQAGALARAILDAVEKARL